MCVGAWDIQRLPLCPASPARPLSRYLSASSDWISRRKQEGVKRVEGDKTMRNLLRA